MLNQVFCPDVASTGQHASDLAAALAALGHRVTVVTSQRGYDNPRLRFPRREVWRGVDVRRLPATGFGKGARWRRAADFASFCLGCSLRLLLLPRFDVVVALTTPPLIAFLAALFVRLKGGRLLYWVMDLNPDQAIAAGWLREGSLPARLLQAMLRYALRSSARIIVLDRFMHSRLLAKGAPAEKILILPPWSHDHAVRYSGEGRHAFRATHGLADKFVVMYSGNHSPCHPLDTVLEAAARLADRPEIHFCFVGGGTEQARIRELAAARRMANITCLPYQPLESLSASLSAADLHVAVMGDAFVGLVHPCKIYNVLAVGKPVLYVGPPESHIADLWPVASSGCFFAARHGEVDSVARHIIEASRTRPDPAALHNELAASFSQDALLDRMAACLESLDPGGAVPLPDSSPQAVQPIHRGHRL